MSVRLKYRAHWLDHLFKKILISLECFKCSGALTLKIKTSVKTVKSILKKKRRCLLLLFTDKLLGYFTKVHQDNSLLLTTEL